MKLLNKLKNMKKSTTAKAVKIERLVPRNAGDEVKKINEIIDYLNEK